MGAALALASAASYGIADFAGGLLSRRANYAAVALVGQVAGFVLTLLLALSLPSAALTVPDIAWGALSGVGTGLGMVYLYRGLSHGAMSVVLPVSAVGGVALPVLVGVTLLGDRPSALAWLGITVAVPALWLVTQTPNRGGPSAAAGTGDALIASAGIAVQYVALAQAGSGAGLWPLVAGRLAAALVVLPLAASSNPGLHLPTRAALEAAAIGTMTALALLLYMLATRQEIMTVAVVLSSLYPAIPVLLGITVLRERLAWQQAVGLLGAGVAIALLALP